MLNKKSSGLTLAQRFGFALVACAILMLGLGAILRGGVEYKNWWGGIVFAPFGVFIGVMVLVIVFRSAKPRSK